MEEGQSKKRRKIFGGWLKPESCPSGLAIATFAVKTGQIQNISYLSSPRAKRAGPKGLRAESAGAFTGRRNSHSGRGEDFLSRQPNFFYGNSCNFGTESRKIVPKVGN